MAAGSTSLFPLPGVDVRHSTLRRLARLAVFSGVALAAPNRRGAAQQPPAPPATSSTRATSQGILVDFQDADIRTVITALAEAAGLNVTFGDLPQHRITLRVRQPIPNDSVRKLLRSVAEANGIRVADEAGLLRFEAAPRPAEVQQTGAARQPGAPQLYVYRLRHARSATLAATLQAIFGGGATTGEPAESNMTPLSQRLREQQVPALRLDTIARGRGQMIGGAPLTSARLQSDVQIVPDENTNSLLVRASPGDWEIVQQAIQAVDLRPLQVLIEVLIAEVRRTNELDVSVAATVNQTSKPDRVGSLTGAGDSPSPGQLLLKWLNSHGDVDVNIALSALATRGDVRILSRPVLLAQNNQEARILVGSQRPFVQVFRSLPTDAGVRDQIVQYRDVGTSLTIVPTVNADGYVNLQLSQEVSSATNETQFGAPVISTREAQTFLFVRDGQTTVIGGLIDHETQRTRSGIPFLVSIPVLGALFGTTHNTTSNSELFLFLTPHVVTSDEDLEDLRESIERRLEHLPGELRKGRPFEPGANPQGTQRSDDKSGAAQPDSAARKPAPKP
jgi:general secretion pathway protein D